MSCYISPNVAHPEFLGFIDDLSDVVRQLGGRILIGGDFNSKSVFWSCTRTDARGRMVEEWAAECELRLVNVGNTPTCVRPQGCSVVDLTWCTPDILGRLSDWKVREDIESLSDHNYILMHLDGDLVMPRPDGSMRVRWNWRTWNGDMFQAAMTWELGQLKCSQADSVNDTVKGIERSLQRACDAAMERVRPGPRRKKVYWWNDTIATARRLSIQARRRWSRAKIRDRDPVEVQELRSAYNAARKNLRKEINIAKLKAWQELINTVDGDPWGLPYRIVLNKLRTTATSH